MNSKVLAILDNALEVADKSDKPQKETICALVQLVNMYDEEGGLCDTELKELALNYARILKDGHNLPKNKLIKILELFGA
jgi:hypothetical protein